MAKLLSRAIIMTMEVISIITNIEVNRQRQRTRHRQGEGQQGGGGGDGQDGGGGRTMTEVGTGWIIEYFPTRVYQIKRPNCSRYNSDDRDRGPRRLCGHAGRVPRQQPRQRRGGGRQRGPEEVITLIPQTVSGWVLMISIIQNTNPSRYDGTNRRLHQAAQAVPTSPGRRTGRRSAKRTKGGNRINTPNSAGSGFKDIDNPRHKPLQV